MSNASKQKGTAWESACAKYLRLNGFRSADRRALAGVRDRGDLTGLPGFVVSCKSVARFLIGEFIDEARAQAKNQDEFEGNPEKPNMCVVFLKRRGFSDPGRSFAIMEIRDYVELMKRAGR